MGRKAGLSREDIVIAAGAVADRDGFESLSIARVAERLGVQSPSLYHHIDGLDDLRRLVAILGAKELGARFRASLDALDGGDGLAAMRAMARAFRAFAQEHPGLYSAAQPATSLDDDLTLYEAAPEAFDTVLAAVGRLGLGPEDEVHVIRSLRAALHGFIALESRPGFGQPDDVDQSFELMLDLMEGGVRAWVAQARRRER
jgi:AcrR family transcriptional regulator